MHNNFVKYEKLVLKGDKLQLLLNIFHLLYISCNPTDILLAYNCFVANVAVTIYAPS